MGAVARGNVGRGTMAAVDGDLDRIAALLPSDVVLANRNHPRQGVISGESDAVARATATLASHGLVARPLQVGAAFHPRWWPEPATRSGRRWTAWPSARRRSRSSARTRTPYADAPDAIRDRLADQLVQPVDWVATVRAMVDRGVTTVIEVGPRGVLCGLVEQCAPEITAVRLDRLADKADGDTQLKRVLAVLATRGHAIDLAPLLAQRVPAVPIVPRAAACGSAAPTTARAPEAPIPALPVRQEPEMKTPTDGWGAVPSSGQPMSKPVHLEQADVPAACAPAGTSRPSGRAPGGAVLGPPRAAREHPGHPVGLPGRAGPDGRGPREVPRRVRAGQRELRPPVRGPDPAGRAG